MAYKLTERGLNKAQAYIRELEAKRKEILDADKDTADDINIPTVEDVVSDIPNGLDAFDNEYLNNWGVTDNYDSDYPLSLEYGQDFVEE